MASHPHHSHQRPLIVSTSGGLLQIVTSLCLSLFFVVYTQRLLTSGEVIKSSHDNDNINYCGLTCVLYLSIDPLAFVSTTRNLCRKIKKNSCVSKESAIRELVSLLVVPVSSIQHGWKYTLRKRNKKYW